MGEGQIRRSCVTVVAVGLLGLRRTDAGLSRPKGVLRCVVMQYDIILHFVPVLNRFFYYLCKLGGKTVVFA